MPSISGDAKPRGEVPGGPEVPEGPGMGEGGREARVARHREPGVEPHREPGVEPRVEPGVEPRVEPGVEPRGGSRLDPALLDAFERELTPDVARRLLELAARRTAMLRAAGVAVGGDEARQLVREALADTLRQVAPWRPGEISLVQHLRGLIRRRTWARLAQIDGPPEAGRGAMAVIERVTAQLSRDSAEDAAVRLVLEAYCNGAVTGEEVSASCNISLEEYAEARRRLDRILAALLVPGASAGRERLLAPLWGGR